jgi:hypothetical protein
MEIVRDINNFAIELGDIVVLHSGRKDMYGLLGIVTSLDISLNYNPCLEILLDEVNCWKVYFAGPEELEVIDSSSLNLLDAFNTTVSLPFHQACKFERSPRCFDWKNIETKKFLKKFEEDYGCIPQPRRFSTIDICWSERGRGFGEYSFWQDGKEIHCANEGDSKETIKRILCRMVDEAILDDPR